MQLFNIAGNDGAGGAGAGGTVIINLMDLFPEFQLSTTVEMEGIKYCTGGSWRYE